jgi:membrane protease subunit HflK
MSDKHDHAGHDHNHDHKHDHGHEHGDIKLPLKSAAAAPTPEPEPERAIEDAGTTALSDALRSSFFIVKFLMVILVIVFFGSGLFVVKQQERVIVLRFGRPVGTGTGQLLGPGLHFGFPAPVDEIVRIPVAELQTARSSAGWYYTTPEMEATKSEPAPGMSLSPASDGYTITSDGNIIHVRADISYRVADPLKYELGFTASSNLVQNVLDEALFFASSQFTVDQVLTSDRLGFREKVLARVRQRSEELGLGITVDNGNVQVIPPRQTRAAFDAALGADIERRQTNDVARGYAGKILSAAEGQANSIINAAETDRARLVQAVAAEAEYFKDQLPHYKSNPQLFMTRLQSDAMARVMTNVTKWFVPQPAAGKAQELRLQLNRDPEKPVAPQDQPPGIR